MKFNMIYLDPPWGCYKDKNSNGERGASFKYPVMSLDDIKALPINSIAANDCALFLWVTCPLLQEGLDVIKAYGFTFKTIGFSWLKENKKSKTLFMGLGHWTRANNEFCLLATKGKPKRINASVRQVVMSPIEKHSKKPDEVRDRIVQLFGDLPRIELFARQIVPGWTCIGNEVDGRDIRESLASIINS